MSTGRKPPTSEPLHRDSLGGFVPEGYWYLLEMVELVAIWGSQGRLPRDLGFVHPGDTVDELLDQPAKVVARGVLGEKLARGALTAEVLLYPSGRRAPLPAIYWSSSSGPATMQDRNSAIDLRRFPEIQNEVASAILHIDAVMAAFGLRWASPETEQPPSALETPQVVPPATPEPPVAAAVPVEAIVAAAVATEPEQSASAVIPPEQPEASADLPKPAIADGVVEAAESSNDVAVPPRMPSDADLDSCIKASAARSKDGKTSGRQLRIDAPPWFAKNHIRPVTQADMERRLNEENAALRRGTGKRRG